MKVLVLAHGIRGAVQPYAALALALQHLADFAHRSFFRIVGSRTGEDSTGSYLGGASTAVTRSLGNGHTLLDQRDSVGGHYGKRALIAPDAEEILGELRAELTDEEIEQQAADAIHLDFNLKIFPNLQIIGIHIREIVPVSATGIIVKYAPMTIEGAPKGINELRLRGHELFYSAAGFGGPGRQRDVPPGRDRPACRRRMAAAVPRSQREVVEGVGTTRRSPPSCRSGASGTAGPS